MPITVWWPTLNTTSIAATPWVTSTVIGTNSCTTRPYLVASSVSTTSMLPMLASHHLWAVRTHVASHVVSADANETAGLPAGWSHSSPLRRQQPYAIRRDRRYQLRRARRVLRRSLHLMTQILGSAQMRAFVSGKTIQVAGIMFDYRLSKRARLVQHPNALHSAHIPYHLAIHTKSGLLLGTACVVFPGLPVLDQVIALCIRVRDRDDERELLRTSNWLTRTDAADGDPEMRMVTSEATTCPG